MENTQQPFDTLNMEVLYFIHAGILGEKTYLYKPEELDIDLLNLSKEGYIEYDGDISSVKITDRGENALNIIFALMND